MGGLNVCLLLACVKYRRLNITAIDQNVIPSYSVMCARRLVIDAGRSQIVRLDHLDTLASQIAMGVSGWVSFMKSALN